MKLPQNKPIALGSLSDEQFNTEIEKGLADLAAGKITSAETVAERMRRDYGDGGRDIDTQLKLIDNG